MTAPVRALMNLLLQRMLATAASSARLDCLLTLQYYYYYYIVRCQLLFVDLSL